ncbi:DUF4395 domain-containing protein, partial [Patescibacteria group bacterium]|nr:DUF4395 domain-containing protein [Patescibacteria group bacterium]
VQNNAFAFCRWSITIIIWCAFFLKLEWLVVLSFVILLISALTGVAHSPLIVIYTQTLGRIIPSKKVVLNKPAMRFAHSIGTLFALICLVLLYTAPVAIAWRVVLIFAIIKTISAFGFCPASKFYTCMSKGGCCAFSKKVFHE